jgi:hypothetical protein
MTQPRRDVNSVDEIVVDRDPAVLEAVIHDIELHSDVLFTWDYERSRTALVKLYEKAKTSQWNATTDLPWDTPVDWDKLAAEASKIVPNVRKLGLLDAGDGWLRTKFTELGIIQFEDGTDTSEEYGDLDAVAADRALTTPAQVGGT